MDFLKDLNIDKVRNLTEDAFNQAKPKTEVEARVYEVLSHKNWGSSSTLLNQIARDTQDYEKFAVISQLMWEAMDQDRPAAWRVVFKGLTLLEHLIKNGSERCVDDARNHGSTLRALHKFNYYEGTVDRGLGVREKSKQLVEILSDDERVREERAKSRKMRDKLTRAGTAASSSGGGGGGGGYGEDNWNSRSSSGSGYGNSGIGSERSGSRGRYGGRYDEDRSVTPDPQPTFAALPPKKKTGKKKKKDPAPVAAAPEVDLFSFDAPASAAPAGGDDGFANFQSAAPTAAVNDPFAAPAPPQQQSFDAFGAAPSQQQQQPQSFDAFGAAPTQPQQQPQSFDAFGGNNNMAFAGGMGGAVNNNVMGGGMSGGSMMNGGMAPTPVVADDDDFGDFADAAAPAPAAAAPATNNSDPMSRLISLDGLSKNTGDSTQDKLNQPVIANAAAASFIQEKDQIQSAMKEASKGNMASFTGIDGLHSSGMGGGMSGGMRGGMMSPSMGMPSNPNVMGGAGGADAISSMMDPSALSSNNTPQQQQPQRGMPNAPQMMGMMGGQQPQMGAAGGQMNPQMMMGAGMGQMGGMQPQMGGMGQQQMNPQIMGMMNPGMMNPGMMQGGMQSGNMPSQMMMNNGMNNMNQAGAGGMNQMGGQQQMGGFR